MTTTPLLSPEARADIQGFVTSGYGHLTHAAYLPLYLVDPDKTRSWLQRILASITTAAPWRYGTGEPKQKPPWALNVALSHQGLIACGLPPEARATFADEFREGMDHDQRSRILGDTGESAPDFWELGNHKTQPTIGALLILNARDASTRDALEQEHREILRELGIELAAEIQRGRHLAGGKEPFGFTDGIGQPSIGGIQRSGLPTGEFVLGYQNVFGFFPLTPVISPDLDPHGLLPASENPYHLPQGLKDLGRHGSYLVYRKLEQSVFEFWSFLQEESERYRGFPDPYDMVWLAAKMVGRWPSGVPLVLSPERDDPGLRLHQMDKFLYAELDPQGLACPFGSHIRRNNPRDMIRPFPRGPSQRLSDAHRILRRGSVFGPELFDLSILDHLDNEEALQTLLDLAPDDHSRGIHFFSVQADIKRQFEFVQQTWANNPRFNGLYDNKDPLIGDNGQLGDPPSRMTIPQKPIRRRTAALQRFVSVKGGGYFFLPGLTALRYLASTRKGE